MVLIFSMFQFSFIFMIYHNNANRYTTRILLVISRRIRVVVDETLHKLLIDVFMYRNSVVAVNILKRERTYEIHKESKFTSNFLRQEALSFNNMYHRPVIYSL